MTRIIVAILLALVMTMSLMSVNVFAETYTVQISSDTYNAYDTTTGVTVSDGQLVATNANIFGIKLPTSISSGEKVYVKLSGSASGNFRVWLSDISQGTKSKEQPTIYPNSFTEAIELTASSTADVLLFKGTTFDSKDINMTLTGITLYTNGTQPPTEDFDTNATILELTKTFKVGYNEIFRTDDNLVKKINAVGDECKFVFNCTSTASIPDFGWAQIMVRDTSDKDENIIIADLTKDLVNGKATVTWGAIKKAISDKGYSWTENKLKFIINTGKNDDGIGDAIDLYLVISKSGEGSATTDPNVCKHEKVTYTDNKDGTHSGVCDNCKKTVVNNEKHTFTGGKCSKCGVSEAEATIPSIPAAPAGYVAKEIVRVTEPIENAGWYVVSGADVSKIVAAMKEKDAIVHLYTTGTSATYGWFGIQLHDTNKKIDNNEYPTLKATTYSGDATKGEVALSTLTKDTSARIATIAVDNENVQKILKAIEENGGSLNAVAIGAGIECNMVGIVVYVPGTADPDCKHENITYTDNKDGTHDGICDSCKKTVVTKEGHTYEEGKCSKCGASETEAVIPEIPAAPEGYVEAEEAKFRVTSEVKANWNPVNDVNTSKLFEAMQKKGAILKVYSTSTTTTSGWVGIQTNSTDYPTYKATTYTSSEATDVATSTVKNENGINVFTVDNENVIKIVNAVKADGGALNGFVLSHDPADGNLIGVVVYVPEKAPTLTWPDRDKYDYPIEHVEGMDIGVDYDDFKTEVSDNVIKNEEDGSLTFTGNGGTATLPTPTAGYDGILVLVHPDGSPNRLEADVVTLKDQISGRFARTTNTSKSATNILPITTSGMRNFTYSADSVITLTFLNPEKVDYVQYRKKSDGYENEKVYTNGASTVSINASDIYDSSTNLTVYYKESITEKVVDYTITNVLYTNKRNTIAGEEGAYLEIELNPEDKLYSMTIKPSSSKNSVTAYDIDFRKSATGIYEAPNYPIDHVDGLDLEDLKNNSQYDSLLIKHDDGTVSIGDATMTPAEPVTGYDSMLLVFEPSMSSIEYLIKYAYDQPVITNGNGSNTTSSMKQIKFLDESGKEIRDWSIGAKVTITSDSEYIDSIRYYGPTGSIVKEDFTGTKEIVISKLDTNGSLFVQFCSNNSENYNKPFTYEWTAVTESKVVSDSVTPDINGIPQSNNITIPLESNLPLVSITLKMSSSNYQLIHLTDIDFRKPNGGTSGGRTDYPGGYILDLGPQFHGLFMSDGKMIPMAHIYNEFGVCTVCGRIQPASETESEGEVVVDTPVEDTDNKSEEEGDDLEVNDNDTPIEQPENNPKTGVVLGVLPLAAAAIAVLVSRKH